MKKHIPNIITLGNLTCGLFAIMYAFSDTPWVGAYFIFGGLFLDFFDGFFARILKVDGELGKQLDSLADLVTFGVAPGMLMLNLFYQFDIDNFNFLVEVNNTLKSEPEFDLNIDFISDGYNPLKGGYSVKTFIALSIPILSALRLAKFNISTNQSDQFIGLPTPANAIYFASLLLIYQLGIRDNEGMVRIYFMGVCYISAILLPLLLNANIPLIALKFKTFGWKGNEVRFIFLVLCLVTILLALLISNVFVAVPIIILLYLIISIINNITKRKNEVQSKH